jgi:uncharacterized protein
MTLHSSGAIAMKIGVLSDTHGEAHLVSRALEILKEHQIELAIHCGDIGSVILPLFDGLPTHFVHGNMDDPSQLRELLADSGHIFHEGLGTIEIDGRQVAFLHGDDVKLLHRTIHSGHWDLVCHGHTHTFSKRFEGKTLILNPGALARTSRPSVAIVDLETMEVTELAV